MQTSLRALAARATIVMTLGGMAPMALAQESSPPPATTTPPPTTTPTTPTTAAPTSEASAEDVTLVSRDAQGALQRLARPTEFAALDVLTLSDAERAGVDALLDARARELDAGVRTKIEQLPRVLRVRSDGPIEDVRLAARDIATAYPALRDRQGLARQIMKVLSTENARAFAKVLNQYNAAAIQQASLDARAKGFKGDAFVMSSQESGRQAALEVCESFDRQCANITREKLEAMLSTLTLADDVKAKVAASVDAFYASKDAPSRSAFFTELMATIPMTERIALAKQMYGG